MRLYFLISDLRLLTSGCRSGARKFTIDRITSSLRWLYTSRPRPHHAILRPRRRVPRRTESPPRSAASLRAAPAPSIDLFHARADHPAGHVHRLHAQPHHDRRRHPSRRRQPLEERASPPATDRCETAADHTFAANSLISSAVTSYDRLELNFIPGCKSSK